MIRRAVGGKRIRLDDPIPPEYENPQTPMTPAGQENEMDVHESWYGRFYITNPSTPQNNTTEIFNEADYDRDNSYDQNDHDQSNGKLFLLITLKMLILKDILFYLSVVFFKFFL